MNTFTELNLNITKENKKSNHTTFLELDITVLSNGRTFYTLYDKRRDFNFEAIQFTPRKSCAPIQYFSNPSSSLLLL